MVLVDGRCIGRVRRTFFSHVYSHLCNNKRANEQQRAQPGVLQYTAFQFTPFSLCDAVITLFERKTKTKTICFLIKKVMRF